MDDPHDIWMDLALSLAARGGGWVSPNPLVGAVVVKNGAAIGCGWHAQFGGPHAEVVALRQAGAAAAGAALYCTLEPCNHWGKTPPCSGAIIAAGIATIVLGARDANPAASGGVEALRAAGIEIIEGVRALECRRINAAFFKFLRSGMPLIGLKWAMSLDGKIATAAGDSKWITGEEARAEAHRLRSRYDAVLAGIGTVLADDPSLNVRLDSVEAETPIRQPRRVVLDTQARTPIGSNLLRVQPGGPAIVVAGAAADASARERIKALRENGAEVIEVERGSDGHAAIVPALQELGKRGALSVLVEGGAGVLGAFVDENLGDRAHIFVAPKIIGGRNSLSAVGGTGAARISGALNFIEGSGKTRQIGPDVLIEGALTEWDVGGSA